jgi:hypothetical protein
MGLPLAPVFWCRVEKLVCNRKKSRILEICILSLAAVLALCFAHALPSYLQERMQAEILRANVLTVTYLVGKEYKIHVISDSEEVQRVLRTFHVGETENGRTAGRILTGAVEFALPRGKRMQYMFVTKTWLQRSNIHDYGPQIIYLADTAFYDEICEIISKVEQRRIDVLKDNP